MKNGTEEQKHWRYGRMIQHGVALGIFFWLIESAADAIAFGSGDTLIDRIIRPTPSESWVRLLSTSVFAVFGIYAHETLAEHRQSWEASQKRADELALLNWLDEVLERDNLSQVLDALSEASKRLFESNGATFYLISDDGQHLLIKKKNLPPAIQEGIEKLIGIEIPQVNIPLRPGSHYLRILEAGEPQINNDRDIIQALASECTDNEAFQQVVPQIIKLMDIRSVLEVPMILEDQPIGLVGFSRRTAFSEWELERARVFARQLTETVQRKQTQRALAQLSLLNDITSKIAAELGLSSVLERAAQLVHESFGYHHVALFILDRKEECLVMKARAGSFADLFPPDHRLSLGQGVVGWAGDQGETVLARDVDAEPRYVNLYPDLIPTKSELSIPMHIGEEVVGVLDIQSPHLNAFSEDDVMAMETLDDQIAVAIKNARLYETAQQELAERQRAEERLEHYAAELERSNKEPQQFAYIASHGLQEPLRMVSSYVQLLERRYKEQLDDDAKESVAFAADGAKRMQRLINDLLAYSRIETRGKPFGTTDSSAVLQKALANLAVTIEETGAVVTHDPLPTVMADETQLTRAFQNLISNAIKFRKNGEKRRVHVSAKRVNNQWVFSVHDNGIGIDPEHHERIFVIFQRLHTRESTQVPASASRSARESSSATAAVSGWSQSPIRARRSTLRSRSIEIPWNTPRPFTIPKRR